jgi:hypothetical protein
MDLGMKLERPGRVARTSGIPTFSVLLANSLHSFSLQYGRMLRNEGFTIFAAKDLLEGWAHLSVGTIDLLILDAMLIEHNEVWLAAVRAQFPALTIVFFVWRNQPAIPPSWMERYGIAEVFHEGELQPNEFAWRIRGYQMRQDRNNETVPNNR